MGRKQKHPEHKERAEALMNELLDGVVALWTSEEEPELKAIAEDVEISPAKLRKLLITAAERDQTPYFSSPTAEAVLRMSREGKSVAEIQETLGLSYTSVQGYLPHKSVYGLDTMSSECERIRLFRARKKAVEELAVHLHFPDANVYLWKCVVAFHGYPFTTSGRGSREGVKFTYEVSKSGSAGGRHYESEQVEGNGNEMWIITLPDKIRKEKSISRSTVDLALKNALAVQEQESFVSGPKKLNVPGAGSYLYPMFVRFGVITSSAE